MKNRIDESTEKFIKKVLEEKYSEFFERLKYSENKNLSFIEVKKNLISKEEDYYLKDYYYKTDEKLLGIMFMNESFGIEEICLQPSNMELITMKFNLKQIDKYDLKILWHSSYDLAFKIKPHSVNNHLFALPEECVMFDFENSKLRMTNQDMMNKNFKQDNSYIINILEKIENEQDTDLSNMLIEKIYFNKPISSERQDLFKLNYDIDLGFLDNININLLNTQNNINIIKNKI